MLYTQPTGAAANAPFIGKNVAAGIQGSKVPAAAVEAPQREIVAMILASGQSPTGTDLQQLLKAARSGLLNFYGDTGTADALIITPDPVYLAAVDGNEFTIVKGAAPNATTTPTLAVNGISQPLKKFDGSPLAAGDLQAGAIMTVRSLNGAFRVMGLRRSDSTVSSAAFNSTFTSNITTIAPQVFNAQHLLSSFTPSVVLSDLPYNVETVIKTLSIPAGTSYIDARGQVAYRNDASQRVSYITELRLIGSDGSNVTAQYIGGAMPSGGGPQQAQPTQRKFTGLSPSATYTLQLIGYKIDNFSNLIVLDGFLEAVYA